MKKIFCFAEKIASVYAVVYLIIIHITAIGLISVMELDFTKPTADIILGVVLITLGFILCELCFLIPSAIVISVSSIISFVMAVSVPVFLFLALFQICGAKSVEVLEFGFIKTLSACIIATPFGIMNLISLKVLGI